MDVDYSMPISLKALPHPERGETGPSIVVVMTVLGRFRQHSQTKEKNIIVLRRKRSYQFRPRWRAKPYSQSSARTPGMRANSRRLLVTTINPSLRAWPPICMSCGPHGVPAR